MARSAEGPGTARRVARAGAAERIESRRFGVLSIAQERVLDLPEGLAGFAGHCRFARVECRPGSPFEWLISLDDPELAFSVADPARVVAGYEPPREEAAAALGANPEDVEFLALVVVPSEVRRMTIDLSAPIAIDRRRRVGRQLVVVDPRWDAAVPILPEKS